MNGRRLIMVFGVVAFVVIMTIAIFSINWGGSSTPAETEKKYNISDYADSDVRVRMTTRGPINSNQEHEELRITVGRDQVVGELMKGYQANVVRSQENDNNTQAYKSFLSALHNAQFTIRQEAESGIQYDGACPRDSRYTLEFIGGSDTPRSSWTTNCRNAEGTFNGDITLVKNLFNNQLPRDEFKALTRNSRF